MRVLITQSNYVPWRGYFAAFRDVDHVVLLDNVQYTRRDWRNRNRIRVGDAPKWLSIPVATKGGYTLPISAIQVSDPTWGAAHASLIEQAYRAAPNAGDARQIAEWIAEVAARATALSKINEHLLRELSARLGISTPITAVREQDELDATERLARIAHELGASTYVSGPAAQAYLEDEAFTSRGMDVEYLDYAMLPPDPEGAIPGAGEYSIIDTVARHGWGMAASLATFTR